MSATRKQSSKSAGPAAASQPRYVRLPPQGEVCPFTGLSRGKINELILPNSRAHDTPPVKSFILPNRGKNQKGVRMIVLSSLLGYLSSLASAAEAHCA